MTARTLFIHHCPDLGGSSVSLRFLLDNLDRRRVTPELLFLCEDGDAVRDFRDRGYPVHLLPGITTYGHASGAWMSLRSIRPWRPLTAAVQTLPSAVRVRDFLRENRFDIVHVNSGVQVASALGARLAGARLVWHVREELHPGYFGLRRNVLRRLIHELPDRVLVISRHNAAQLTPSPKIEVVYNCVDFGVFDRRVRGTLRAELGVGPSTQLVGMLGGAIHNKGAVTFAETAARVRREIRDVRFVLLGYPPRAESPNPVKRAVRRGVEGALGIANVDRDLPEAIRRHGLEDMLVFAGMRNDVASALADMDVVMFPATESHFGRPILEAGAMGKPIVASDFPSTRELVRDGETGLLADSKDPDAFAACVLRLLRDAELARRMGDAGHRLALERYSAEAHARAIEANYERLLSS